MDWEAVRDIISVIAGKWEIVVIAQLAEGSLRYNELLRGTGLDGRQLTRVLRNLEEAGLVIREVRAEQRPLQVIYRLTPRARALFEPLDALARRWSHGYGNGEASH